MSIRMRCFAALLAAVSLAACGGQPSTDAGVDAGGGGTGGGGTGGGGTGGGATGGGGGADVIAPTIRSTSPSAGATGVTLDVSFVVAFSEPMNPSSVTTTVDPAVTLGTPTFDTDNSSMTVAPAAALSPNTTYSVTIAGNDVAGNALTGLKTFSFTTMMVDLTAPTVSSTVPAKDATNVSVSSPLAVTFSEPMAVSGVTVGISPVIELGDPTWSDENRTVTFTPPTPFVGSTLYTVTLDGEDLAENDLGGSKTFSFTTGAPPDTTPPTITDTSPNDGATGVSNNTIITLHFSEPMRTADTAAAITLQGSATLTNCDGRWLWNTEQTIVSCQPSPVLAFSLAHHVIVGVGARDVAGNALAAAYSFGFTTGAAPDTTPPTVSSVSPANSAVGVERSAYVTVNLSESMDTTATQGAFSCVIGSTTVGGTFGWLSHNTSMRFTPSSTFSNGVTVSCTLRGGAMGARDVAGNRLAANYTWSFRVLRYTTLDAPALNSLDGFIYNAGNAYGTLTYVFVGDTSANLSSRGYFAFNIAALPSETRRVTGATLYLYAPGTTGVPSSLGTLVCEHVDYGSTLTASDYGTASLSSAIAISASTGVRQVPVTSWAQDDFVRRATRGNRSEYRLRFTTEVTADSAADGIMLTSGEWGTVAQRPYLRLGYEYP